MKMILFSTLGLSILATAALAEPGEPAPDRICDGLTGAAFGMCVAAIQANQCDIDPTTEPCVQLSASYERITGATPPWLLTCPTDLIVGTGGWYETDPAFSAVNTITLDMTFRSDSASDLTFYDYQLWSLPSIVTDLPVVEHAVPEDPVALGETFRYRLEVNVSGLPEGEEELAFRAMASPAGTLHASIYPVVTVSITCD